MKLILKTEQTNRLQNSKIHLSTLNQMLNTLHAKNFTLFSDATFEFAPGLNVIIGDNGTGKSHLLTLAYTTLYVLNQALREYMHSATPLSEAWWALEPSRT